MRLASISDHATDGSEARVAIATSGDSQDLDRSIRPDTIVSLEVVPGVPPREVIAAAIAIDGTLTQDGVARVFAEQFRDKLHYCHHTGCWFCWDGSRWQKDETSRAFHFARLLSRELSKNEDDAGIREARKVSFAGGVEKFARGDDALAVTSSYWDSDPLLLGTPGGTVDLKTGRLSTPDPRDGITKQTSVAPTKTAGCPRWIQFLQETTGGDVDLIRFLQTWAGYSLTGLTREHALVFVYGPGGNGKSVFLNVLTGIMADYATTAAMDTFTASAGDRHPTDLAMLRGARLVTASETEDGRAWAEAKIKQLTGGDPVSARFMRRDFFTYQPTFKLTIVGNHQPVLRNVDEAARRRFRIVPFTRKPDQPDRELEVKLKAEWPAILEWMIQGCLLWQREGLSKPATVVEATDAYFAEQDALAQWLDERCDADPGNPYKSAGSSELYASWSAFAKSSGDEPGSQKSFVGAMRTRGFTPYRDMHGRGFRGLALRRSHDGYDAS